MKQILLVEDDSDDVYLFNQACKIVDDNIEVVSFADGENLIDYVQGNDCRGKLVFLDLNMPRLDGISCLKELTRLNKVNELIVIVCTTSSDPNDVHTSYQYGAKSYVTKPHNLQESISLIQNLVNYWFYYNLIPGCPDE